MPLKLLSSGGGSVLLTANTTASDFTVNVPAVNGNMVTTADTGSITQAMLGAGVYAGYGPAFSAYLSSNQNINFNTSTKIQYNTKEFDTANCYDNTTNYRFTPNVAGYYQITGSWLLNSGGSVYSYAMIYKNGSQFKATLGQNSSGVSTLVTALIYMNGTTDYVELYAQFTTANNAAAGLQAWTYFQGHLVRAA